MKYLVYRQRPGRTFGVFRQPASDGTGQELVEGGFFGRAYAEAAAQRLRDEGADDVSQCGKCGQTGHVTSLCRVGDEPLADPNEHDYRRDAGRPARRVKETK